ncbi:MAG: cytochrome P450 [Acidimicrobiia bacterium]
MTQTSRNWCEDFDHRDPDFVSNPWPILEALRIECPVVHSDRYGGFWLLTRYEDVAWAARSPHEFTSAVPGVTSIPPIQGPRSEPNLPIELDPPVHAQYRALISAAFRRRRIEEMRPGIDNVAGELLESIIQEGEADLVSDFAVPLSLYTLGAFMSLPHEDQHKWHNWVDRMFEGSIRDPFDAAAAKGE